jgi:hypothetical protein
MAIVTLKIPTHIAVERGLPEKVTLDINLAVPENVRKELAQHVRNGEVSTDYKNGLWQHLWPGEITPDAVAGMFAAHRNAEQADADAKQEAKLAHGRAVLAKREAILKDGRDWENGGVHYEYPTTPTYDVPDEIRESAEWQAWQAELDVVRDRNHAEALAERQRKLADEEKAEKARDAEKAAQKAEREAWVLQHGSKRLQRLLAEKIEHDSVYFDERLTHEHPAWEWQSEIVADGFKYELKAPRNAPEKALDLLDEARKDVPDAMLQYLTIYRPIGDDWDETVDEDGDAVDCRGYCATGKFLGKNIVLKLRVWL